MNIKQLTYFSAVFELRNMSHAASRHSVAQSAISHHISNLEAELGVSLFIRKSRGMEPTAAGNRLYSHAKNILSSIKSAKQDMMRESEEIAGEIAIGLPFSVMKGIGLPLMETILRDFPKVRLTIVESLSEITLSNLISSEVDFAFFYNPQKDMRITMEFVLEEEVLCVGKPSIIGNSDKPMTFNQLATLPVLLLRQGASSRALIDRPGLLSKLEANASLQLNSISGIINGMLAGMGCTIAPKVFVKEQLSAGLLHARPIKEPELSRRLYIGYRRDCPSNQLFEVTKQMILDLIKSNVRNNEWEATLASNIAT
jgi:LysR family nitrogen assimilation transcriptional regulator